MAERVCRKPPPTSSLPKDLHREIRDARSFPSRASSLDNRMLLTDWTQKEGPSRGESKWTLARAEVMVFGVRLTAFKAKTLLAFHCLFERSTLLFLGHVPGWASGGVWLGLDSTGSETIAWATFNSSDSKPKASKLAFTRGVNLIFKLEAASECS